MARAAERWICRYKPAINIPWARSRKGNAYQRFGPLLSQPVAVSENGNAEIAHTLINPARSIQRVCAEVRNKAPPARIRAALHDAAPLEARILQHAEMESDVDALAHDVDIMVRKPQPHLDLGIAVAEFGDARSDQPSPEPEWRRHPDRAARLARNRRDCRFGLGHGVEHLLGSVVEDAAVFGRRQLPRRAVEEPHTQIFLQLLDTIGGNRRRDAHVAASGRQIAEFHDADEDADIVQIGHGPHLAANRRFPPSFSRFF